MLASLQLHEQRRRQRRGRGAFTLIELLLVMVIIVILAGIVLTRVTGTTQKAKNARAVADITAMRDALQMYEKDVGSFPTTEEGLQALISNPGNAQGWGGPYLQSKDLKADPWGKAYVYKCPGDDGQDFDCYSTGADGQSRVEPQ